MVPSRDGSIHDPRVVTMWSGEPRVTHGALDHFRNRPIWWGKVQLQPMTKTG